MSERVIRCFTPNKKYHRWYFAIVERARGRTLDNYKERHHIIPRSLGGNNEAYNLVELTFREHFLAHWLLVKMTEGKVRQKMCTALHWMCYGHAGGNRKIVATGWQYDVARRAAYDAQIGNKHHPRRSKRMSISMKKVWAKPTIRKKFLNAWKRSEVRKRPIGMQ